MGSKGQSIVLDYASEDSCVEIMMIYFQHLTSVGLFSPMRSYRLFRMFQDDVQPYPIKVPSDIAPAADPTFLSDQLYYCRASMAIYGSKQAANVIHKQNVYMTYTTDFKTDIASKMLTIFRKGSEADYLAAERRAFAENCLVSPTDVHAFHPYSAPYMPGSALYVRHATREIILSVRGTFDFTDVYTDAQFEPCELLPFEADISTAFSFNDDGSVKCRFRGLLPPPGGPPRKKGAHDSSTVMCLRHADESSEYFGHTGIFLSAIYLYGRYWRSIASLLEKHSGYTLVLTGHSLGGSAALMFGWLIVKNGLLRRPATASAATADFAGSAAAAATGPADDDHCSQRSDNSDSDSDNDAFAHARVRAQAQGPVHSLRIHVFSAAPCGNAAVLRDLHAFNPTNLFFENDLVPRSSFQCVYATCYRLLVLAEVCRRKHLLKLVASTRRERRENEEGDDDLRTSAADALQPLSLQGLPDGAAGSHSFTVDSVSERNETSRSPSRQPDESGGGGGGGSDKEREVGAPRGPRRACTVLRVLDKPFVQHAKAQLKLLTDGALFSLYTSRCLEPPAVAAPVDLYVPCQNYAIYFGFRNVSGWRQLRKHRKQHGPMQGAGLVVKPVPQRFMREMIFSLEAIQHHLCIYMALLECTDSIVDNGLSSARTTTEES